MILLNTGNIKKEYKTRSNSPLEEYIGCTNKLDLTSMTFKISQSHLIGKTNQGLNYGVKSPTTFNTSATTHKGIVRTKKQVLKLKNIYRRYTRVSQDHYYTLKSINNQNYQIQYARRKNVWMK